MTKKFIKNRESTNFVFPNKKINEYGIDIIHDINDNPVEGTINSISISSYSTDSITIDLSFKFERNGAELYHTPLGNTQLMSFFLMHPDDLDYYNPWRLVSSFSVAGVTPSYTGDTYSISFDVTKEDLNINSIPNGIFTYQVRFIGRRYVDIRCGEITALAPSPTPSITPSVTPSSGISPTPTPSITATPSISVTPTPSPSSGVLTLTQYCYTPLYACGDTLHCESPDYTKCASITWWDEFGDAHYDDDICLDNYNLYTVNSSAIPIVQGMVSASCDTCNKPSISVSNPSVGTIFIDRLLTNSDCVDTILQYSSDPSFGAGNYVELFYDDYCGDITLSPFEYDTGTWYFRIKEICDGINESAWSDVKSYTF